MAVAAFVWLGYQFWRLLCGSAPIWHLSPNGAVDLKIRRGEVHRWFAGRPIYNEPKCAMDPPATYAILWLLLGWLELTPARWLWAATTLATLGWLVYLIVQESGTDTPSERVFVALMPLSMYATGATIGGLALPRQRRSNQGIGLGLSLMVLATLASWTYENPITSNTMASSMTVQQVVEIGVKPRTPSWASLIQPNDAAIREGLKHVPDNVYLVTTNTYAPHLSHRRNIELLPRAPELTAESEVEAIFLNLKDLYGRVSCEDYRQYLESAAHSGFGVTFYRDSVLLIQRGKGDSRQLKELLDSWPGCG